MLRWVSLLCMQTWCYRFHGCILVPSHKCDDYRQVPKRELHELTCHFTDNSFVTNACSQYHQLKVNLEVHRQFKMKSISYRIFRCTRPHLMRIRSAELKGRKAFTSCVQLRPVPEASSSTFWFLTGFCSGVLSGILLCLWLISE